ncbi:site-specific integrase [Gemmobacter nectariphilus]|uniref:site-specific integrase n=1 Tax=Gemmobacter nectariphilus TaxID=220343 RepID=UPI00041F0D03|nr:site-specific integrase [Gemmobacter nectariphilus]
MKHTNPDQLELALMAEGTPTLASVINEVQSSADLSDGRRRDMASGLRRVASALGRDPGDIPAVVKWLQPRLAEVMPAALGVTDKSWQNAVSDAKSALAHVGIIPRHNRQRDDLSAPWRDLWQAALASKDKSLTVGLGRFVHFLSDQDVDPEEVSQHHADAFHESIAAGEIRKEPEWVWKNAVWGWNLAVDRIPGWPQTRLSMPSRKIVITLPDEDLPAGFLGDLGQMMQRLSAPDIFAEDGPTRALRPTTIEQQTAMLKRFASELVHAGVPAMEINSVRALCDPRRAELGLRAMVARNGGEKNTVIADMAVLLCSTARRLDLPESTIKALAKHAKRLARPSQSGLTRKNRDRLRALQDPATLRRLLLLPEQLIRASARMTPKNAALAREDALAIAILLVCPLRIKNLSQLHVERDLQRPGKGQVFIAIGEDQVKNGQPIEFELPPDVRKMLDKHLGTRVPLLCPQGCPWLFPRRDGTGPIAPTNFSTRLSKQIRKEIGLAVNPHLFRHLTAMIWLTANPGAYEAARRLLGHTSTRTTINFYAGLETSGAVQALGDILAEKRKRK